MTMLSEKVITNTIQSVEQPISPFPAGVYQNVCFRSRMW